MISKNGSCFKNKQKKKKNIKKKEVCESKIGQFDIYIYKRCSV